MKTRLLTIALLAPLAAVACDSKPEAPEATKIEVPTQKEIKAEVKSGVKDVLNNKGPKWKFDYSGDLSGSVEGGIMAVTSVSTTTVAHGGAMTADKRGKAEQSFTARITKAGDKQFVSVDLKLADGTKCRTAGAETKIDLKDPERKTFTANLSGSMQCGADKKKISYKAVLKK